MAYIRNWKYFHAIDRALKIEMQWEWYLSIAVLIIVPVILLIASIVLLDKALMIMTFIFLLLSIIFYFTIYQWHSDTVGSMQGFDYSVELTLSKGIITIADGRTSVTLPLKDVVELSIFSTAYDSGPSFWWIIVSQNGLEYVIQSHSKGVENLLRVIRDLPGFSSDPIYAAGKKVEKLTCWKKGIE
ncbi:hypothetical protein ACFL7E_08430 [Thermodesulfobacteriota bacterium]